jgi:predicted MFS family arabinose efflux permease
LSTRNKQPAPRSSSFKAGDKASGSYSHILPAGVVSNRTVTATIPNPTGAATAISPTSFAAGNGAGGPIGTAASEPPALKKWLPYILAGVALLAVAIYTMRKR